MRIRILKWFVPKFRAMKWSWLLPLLFLFVCFWLHRGALRVSFPWLGIEPGPQQWKPRILTTMPTRNSHYLKKIFFYLKNLFICLHWVLVAAQDLVAAYGIFSCRVWKFSCGMWNLVPWLGIESGPPELGGQSLSYWTSRDVFPIIFRVKGWIWWGMTSNRKGGATGPAHRISFSLLCSSPAPW